MKADLECKLCGGTSFRYKYDLRDYKHNTTTKEFPVFNCRDCNAMLVTESGRQIDTSTYYPTEYAAFREPESRGDDDKVFPFRVVRGRMAWAKSLSITKDFSILDIGCGSGKLIKFLQDKFEVSVEGIEPNQEAVEAGRRAGLNIHCGVLESVELTNQYDLVYLIHVIEHLPDPLATIERVFSLLKTNGKLVICTPNHMNPERSWFGKYWDGWDTPRHIYVFDARSIKKMLKRLGFVDIQIRYEVYSLFNRSNRNKKLETNTKAEDLSNMLEKLISYFMALLGCSGAFQITATKSD